MTEPIHAADRLVCGTCQKNFLFSSFEEFIQHKLFKCQGTTCAVMACHSCPQKFSTPWSLLQHAQSVHALKIFSEEGPYAKGIQSINIRPGVSETDNQLSVSTSSLPAVVGSRAVTAATDKVVSGMKTVTSVVPIPQKPPLSVAHVTGSSGPTRTLAAVNLPANTKGSVSSVGPEGTVTSTCAPVVPIVLPKIVQVNCDMIRSVVAGPHSIPVLRPIQLQQGAMIRAPAPVTVANIIRPPSVIYPLGTPATQSNVATQSSQTVPTSSTPVLVMPKPAKAVDAADGPRTASLPVSSKGAKLIPSSEQEYVSLSQLKETVVGAGEARVVTVSVQQDATPRVEHMPKSHPVVPATTPGILSKEKSDSESSGAALISPAPISLPLRLARSKCPCCEVSNGCPRSAKPPHDPGKCSGCPCGPIASTKPLQAGTDVTSTTETTPNDTGHVVCSDVAVQADRLRCCQVPSSKMLKSRDNRKRSLEGISVKKGGSGQTDDEDDEESELNEEDTVPCCDNQDCGVTIMPGTHEGLKKCCNAVVPKKRKRHMETKHRVRKRAAAATAAGSVSEEAAYTHSEANTIYIDFQPNSVVPRVSTSNPDVKVSTSSSSDTIHVNNSSADLQQTTLGGDKPSSLTLSIPVNYTRTASRSLLDCGSGLCIPLQPTQGHGQGCRCECCPLARQILNSVRDKKLKASRRPSGGGDSRRTGDTSPGAAAPMPSGKGLFTKMKTEHLDGGHSESGTGSSLKAGGGQSSKKSSLTGRPKPSVKKRRYPTSRPFKCDQCDHAFNQRIHLKKHQSKHTGIKPFKCEQCDYSTVERSHLKVHIRVHTGEKPFKCPQCDYATAQNSTLKIHLRRHHGVNAEDGSAVQQAPFSCDDCSQDFDDEELYRKHQESHTSENSLHAASSDQPTEGAVAATADQPTA